MAALPFNLHTQELMQTPETYVARAMELSEEGAFDKVGTADAVGEAASRLNIGVLFRLGRHAYYQRKLWAQEIQRLTPESLQLSFAPQLCTCAPAFHATVAF